MGLLAGDEVVGVEDGAGEADEGGGFGGRDLGREKFVGEKSSGGALICGEIINLLTDVAGENGEFLRAGFATQGELEGMANFGFKAFGLIAKKAGGKSLRDLEEGRVIRDGEGLQRSVGANAVGADGLEVRSVEG
jgi:hypothetical protein